MNKAVTAGLLVAGALIAYNAFAKGVAGGNLVFFPDKIHSLQVTGGGPVMKLYIRVQNTSNQNFVINSLAGNVFVNKYLVGNAENFTAITVGPNTQTTYPVTIRLSWLGVVNTLFDAFNGGPSKVVLSLEAHANVDRYQMPVNLTFNVGK